MSAVLGWANVSAKGQVTIPAAIRARFGIISGGEVVFFCSETGALTVGTPTELALMRTQRLFALAARAAHLQRPADVLALITRLAAKYAPAPIAADYSAPALPAAVLPTLTLEAPECG